MDCDRSEVLKALVILYGQHDLNGWAELRMIDPNREFGPTSRSVRWNPQEPGGVADELYRTIQGTTQKRNCYVGRALRTNPGYGSANAVDWVTCVSLDVDAVRAGEGPATDAEMARCREALERSGPSGPARIMTGNGYQLWWPLSQPADIRGRREWWANAQSRWEHDVTKGLPREVCKVDPQSDIPRVVKLPGTVGFKQTPQGIPLQGFRMARVERFASNTLDPVVIMGWADKEFGGVRTAAPPTASALPDKFWVVLGSDQKLREAWSGTRGDLADNSQSAQDMALVSRLRLRGFTADEAFSILRMSPYVNRKGNWSDGYGKLTVQKVYVG